MFLLFLEALSRGPSRLGFILWLLLICGSTHAIASLEDGPEVTSLGGEAVESTEPSASAPTNHEVLRIDFSSAVLNHPRVDHFIRNFSGRNHVSLRLALARSGRYRESMSTIFRAEGLPQDLLYLCLIESGFSPLAISQTRTAGLWQFTYGTGRAYGLKIDSWVDERKDPLKSTRAAAFYLKDLYKQFDEWLWVVAAFNSGDEGVKRALRGSQAKTASPLDPKIPLKPGTRDFVAKFVASSIIAREPERYGFSKVSYEADVNYEEVMLTEPVKLGAIAEWARTTVEVIRQLNPALLHNVTPPHGKPFLLRLPAGKGSIFSAPYLGLPKIPQIRLLRPKAEEEETEQLRMDLTPTANES